MRRFVPLVVVALVAVAAYAVIGLAQEPAPPGGGGGWGMMEEEPGVVGGPAGPAFGRTAIAVSGNSVYVISGNLLLKYDSDLNLIKQVELPRGEMPAGMGRGGRMGRGGGGGGRGGGGGGGGGRGGGGPRAW